MNINRLTKEQAAIIGCFTGIACGPFSDVHEIAVVQRRVDDPVKTTTPPLIGSQWAALITRLRCSWSLHKLEMIATYSFRAVRFRAASPYYGADAEHRVGNDMSLCT